MARVIVCDDCGVTLREQNAARKDSPSDYCVDCKNGNRSEAMYLVPDEEVNVWNGERVGPRRHDY